MHYLVSASPIFSDSTNTERKLLSLRHKALKN
jgi:hypothetical protein